MFSKHIPHATHCIRTNFENEREKKINITHTHSQMRSAFWGNSLIIVFQTFPQIATALLQPSNAPCSVRSTEVSLEIASAHFRASTFCNWIQSEGKIYVEMDWASSMRVRKPWCHMSLSKCMNANYRIGWDFRMEMKRECGGSCFEQ